MGAFTPDAAPRRWPTPLSAAQIGQHGRANTEQPTEVLAGAIEHITFHNPPSASASSGSRPAATGELVTVVGHAAEISAGEWDTMSGTWVKDREHGQQFKDSFLRSSPATTAERTKKVLSSGMTW